MTWIIPPAAWKRLRDTQLRRAARRLHITETNPGPDSSRLRFDYILTRSELGALVEEVMRDTERHLIFHLDKKKEP